MLKKSKKKYVELFSGCGGMSLGLESAGYSRLLANEISPMAAETFAYNLINSARNGCENPDPQKIGSWNNYFSFLTDSPFKKGVAVDDKSYRDWRNHRSPDKILSARVKKILTEGASPNLLVGHAGNLANILEKLQFSHKNKLWHEFKNIDILAGGPPCQSFSLAGKRQKDHPRNSLFLSFVKVAKILNPKVIFFENVVGITKSFQDEDGHNYHPWFEVCRAFRAVGYIPIPSLVNAAYYGVPQARPRFIMLGIREDLAKRFESRVNYSSPVAKALRLGRQNYCKDMKWKNGCDRELIFMHDSELARKTWPSPLFPVPLADDNKKISVREAIEDLVGVSTDEQFYQGSFARNLDIKLKRPEWIMQPGGIKNHTSRSHGDKTRARFRLLRVLAEQGFRAKSMSEVIKKRIEQ